MHPAWILVLGVLTLGAIVFTLLVAQWLYLDHRARKAYALRVHLRTHSVEPVAGCPHCARRFPS